MTRDDAITLAIARIQQRIATLEDDAAGPIERESALLEMRVDCALVRALCEPLPERLEVESHG